MRCKACNKCLTDGETYWNPTTKEHGSLCGSCKPVSNTAVEDIQSEDWQPIQPVYPHDLVWDGVAHNYPDPDN